MSHDVNTRLLDRAVEAIDLYEGTLIARVIEEDIKRNDLDSLYMHVCQAEAQAAEEDYHASDSY